jgi:hypothetical protein
LAAYVIAIVSAGENSRVSVLFNSRRDKFRQQSSRLPAELRKEFRPARERDASAATALSEMTATRECLRRKRRSRRRSPAPPRAVIFRNDEKVSALRKWGHVNTTQPHDDGSEHTVVNDAT